MRVLSIRHPWAALLAHGYKTIENRDWTTPYRGPLLLHASKTFDKEAPFDEISNLVGECVYCNLLESMQFGGVVGIAELVDIVTESNDPWFCGIYGWVLHNAKPLPFFPMPGRLSLFAPSHELIAHVRRYR